MYDYTRKIRDTEVKFRKWKVKDRKNLIKSISTEEGLTNDVLYEVLVRGCLEKPDVAFSPDELKYLLSQIRIESLGDDMVFEFDCISCDEVYDDTIKLSTIIKPVNNNAYKDIITKDNNIEISEVISKEFYDKTTQEAETEIDLYMIDFMLHIKSINKNDTFTFDELIDIIDEFDVKELDDILNEWDTQKFTTDDSASTTCPKCSNTNLYEFDEVPGLIPVKWFNR